MPSILISGDFNHASPSSSLPKFTQYVTCHTRDNKTLDLFYANTKEAYHSLPLPPLGRADHNLVHSYRRKMEHQLQQNNICGVWKGLKTISGFNEPKSQIVGDQSLAFNTVIPSKLIKLITKAWGSWNQYPPPLLDYGLSHQQTSACQVRPQPLLHHHTQHWCTTGLCAEPAHSSTPSSAKTHPLTAGLCMDPTPSQSLQHMTSRPGDWTHQSAIMMSHTIQGSRGRALSRMVC
ncbi:hypothetical protein L3Q82_021909 [Scortum barcoo]|uniref:Uncharacterized protein n=1 Tax=Scortum barcoo TaxID=214431 RepID=A0ACB8X6U4_9TELE|nr:hypothetical protein L3Q82_021909 [Scortum barcoo]